MPDQVAEACEQRDAERADDQLRGLEPVDVGVRDPEVVGDVGEDRRVVALQDAAGDLDADQEADDAEQVGADPGRSGVVVVISGASRSACDTR